MYIISGDKIGLLDSSHDEKAIFSLRRLKSLLFASVYMEINLS